MTVMVDWALKTSFLPSLLVFLLVMALIQPVRLTRVVKNVKKKVMIC